MASSNRIVGYLTRDNYGHEIGKVICFWSNAKGNVKRIAVKKPDGAITEFDDELFDIRATEVVVYDQLVLKARTLSKELILCQRRLEALEKLKNEGRISSLTFEDLKAEFNAAFETAKSERDKLIEDLKRKNVEMARQIVYLQKLMATVDVQYMTGEVDESGFRMAVSEIKASIEKLTEEKAELDKEFELLNLRVIQKETPVPAEPKPPLETQTKALTVIPGKSIFESRRTPDDKPTIRLP